MSPNTPGIYPQAIVKVVPRGGTVNADQIHRQICYITRNGTIPFRRSERYLGAPPAGMGEFRRIARDWARDGARYPLRNRVDGTPRDLTTHIVVSLPANTPHQLAEDTLRAYAFEMFGSGRNGGQWDYFTAFHTDRAHPHLHIVVNRLSHEGRWLKISRRDPFMNYDNMRAVMSDVAYSHGINLDSTSRAERGIIERPVTFAEYRRRARDRVFVYPQPIDNTQVEPEAIIGQVRSGADRQRARDAAAAAAARARARFVDPLDDLEEVLAVGGDDNNEDHDRAGAGEDERAAPDNGVHQNDDRRRRPGRDQQRRAPQQRSIIETRNQRRVREQQEAAHARVEERRRLRAEQTREAERRRRARDAPPVARTRAQERELNTLSLRSGNQINRTDRQAGRSDRNR